LSDVKFVQLQKKYIYLYILHTKLVKSLPATITGQNATHNISL